MFNLGVALGSRALILNEYVLQYTVRMVIY